MLQPDFGQNVFLVHCLSELIGRDEFLVQKECLCSSSTNGELWTWLCLQFIVLGAQDGISKETSQRVATSEVYLV